MYCFRFRWAAEVCEGTADFLLFMGKLFDSVNNPIKTAPYSKPLKGAVNRHSSQVSFWYGAIKFFEHIHFSNEKKTSYTQPSLKNWITTIKGFIQMWNNLQKNKVEYFCTRKMNQDALENFFGIIRSHRGRNVNPTASNFKGSFKTLIMNYFSAASSPWADCEEDISTGSLNSLRVYLEGDNAAEELEKEEDEFVLSTNLNTRSIPGL